MPRHAAELERVNVGGALAEVSEQIAQELTLDKAVSRLEARVLAAHAWQVSPSWLIAHDTDLLTPQQLGQLQTLIERRLRGEPIAYITGKREFFGHAFRVTPDVLIPRPETELLVEVLLAHIPVNRQLDILELGTGSGCIAISLALARPLARVTAVDNKSAALAIAQENARQLQARLNFAESNWFSALAAQKFDFIVSNPPYVIEDDPHLDRGDVRYEPSGALRSGKDGMDDLQYIIEHASAFIKTRGGLILEHGYNQAEKVANLLKINAFKDIKTWQDLSGRDRVTAGFLSE